MSSSRQQRLHPDKKKKRLWPKILIGFLIVVAVLVGLVIAFPFQSNNVLRSAMGGRDTPVDTAAKNQLVTALKGAKSGNSTTDALIDEAASRLQNTSMSQVRQAAQSSASAASLIQSETGISASQAQALSSFVFSHPEFTSIRQAIADGNWLQAYKAYKAMDNTDLIDALKSEGAGQ
ncbi:hypothetical protein [Schleiferilactobacillus shenzhenensis]|nr:hypothetical protein [Schleiferilactobacillus shenzhenensis]